MRLKKVVLSAVVTAGGGMLLILLLGLALPNSMLQRMSIGASKDGTATTANQVTSVNQANPADAGQSAASAGSGTASSTSGSTNTGTGTGSPPSGSTSGSGTGSTPGSGTGSGSGSGSGSGGGGTGGGTLPPTSIGSFAASPTSVAYQGSSTLSWSTSNATSCSISPSIGTVAVSGSHSTGSLTTSTTFTLSCSGNGSVSRQTSVSVAAPPPACGQAGGSCTTSQVATHNSQSNCWMIYGGKWYVVTAYVSSHPGGRSVFNSQTCGVDVTAYMNGTASTNGTSYKHSASAYATLQSFTGGPVQ